eukprot:Pgem_evm1s8281
MAEKRDAEAVASKEDNGKKAKPDGEVAATNITENNIDNSDKLGFFGSDFLSMKVVKPKYDIYAFAAGR